MPITDEHLMMRVREGDQQAFEELYQRYSGKVFSYLMRLLGDRMIAEEYYQETFLRLYRAAARYEPQAKFTTFLFRIATNLALNELKRRRLIGRFFFRGTDNQREGGAVTQAEDNVVDETFLPDQLVYGQEIGQHLRAALMSLPEFMRATLILSEIEGKRYEEVAEILDCSVGTVKSRVNRARAKIRRYFEEHDIL